MTHPHAAAPLIHILVSTIDFIDYILSFFRANEFGNYPLPDPNANCTKEIIDSGNSTEKVFRSSLFSELTTIADKDHNLYKEFIGIAKKYADKKALGTREKLEIREEVQPDGKIIKKFLQSPDYEWMKFKDVVENIDNISNGLLTLGLKSNDNIVINAETRAEWLISALACFRIKVPIVTLYATLGIEALEFGIEQTETKFLVISGEQISKIEKILSKINSVTHIVVIGEKFYLENYNNFKKQAMTMNKTVLTYDEVYDLGKSSEVITDYESPKNDDLAIVMYTSGSTGNPKGAMISHGNLLISSKTLRQRMEPIDIEKDVYIGYLPLAHVLELATEFIVLNGGIAVGYSSPQTITDASTGIIKGEMGDLRVLNPSIMHSVPAVLERLSKAVKIKIAMKGNFFMTLFDIAYKKKLYNLKNGRQSKLLDKILFSKISTMVIGRNLRFLMCAGALLSEEVHEFVQVCLCPVRQAYGLTETLACGTTQLINQFKTGVVGSVVPSSELRLIDWNEGEYRNTDKPYPRGEIYIGGENVILGYYKMPEKTIEDFKVINGIRFFATGDIGEMNTDTGLMKLIDRKKDIVKLSGGEYVSLNKVEAFLKLLPFVDNCCVIANPIKSYTVCLICPNQNKLSEILHQEKDLNNNIILKDGTLDELKADKEKNEFLIKLLENNQHVNEKITKEAISFCLNKKIAKFEVPTKYKFVPDLWLPETGLVTDSLKIKRVNVDKFYKAEISELYSA